MIGCMSVSQNETNRAGSAHFVHELPPWIITTRIQPLVAFRGHRRGIGTGELGRGYPSALRAKIFRLITLIHTIPTVPARFGSIFFIQIGVYGMATVQNRVEK